MSIRIAPDSVLFGFFLLAYLLGFFSPVFLTCFYTDFFNPVLFRFLGDTIFPWQWLDYDSGLVAKDLLVMVDKV